MIMACYLDHLSEMVIATVLIHHDVVYLACWRFTIDIFLSSGISGDFFGKINLIFV
ncbi:hypothetical protein VR7878_02501 [Vibrio ruber DSM 16370]|uniref:Uncharacterized protein n=1 Tax=Vibrio ruber (strain DSM 16370 / JCM 11486 / BCRC 17186 / CECT 7878 / LMG 23124 / VR1) TaxID=1123498 RepID=A0A1R4LMY7_VIBR1|nr:hypothetical protein VR7878_02501 [Vibrio ruber DSM 16370]